jgi:hypothetical protein
MHVKRVGLQLAPEMSEENVVYGVVIGVR